MTIICADALQWLRDVALIIRIAILIASGDSSEAIVKLCVNSLYEDSQDFQLIYSW